MEENMGLVQLLADFNYTFQGECNCDGFKTFKYVNKDHQFRWRVKKGQFKIKQHGVTKFNWRKLDQAEQTLKSIHEVAV